MADYYPLVAKAVAGLEKNTGEGRRALYERARTALVAQLRGMNDPPLTEAEITRERLALEEAIRKVEAEAARRGREGPRPETPKAPEGTRDLDAALARPSAPGAAERPLPPPRPPRAPGERRSVTDEGLKGFRDVIAEAEALGEATAQGAKAAREVFAATPPSTNQTFDRLEPRVEPEGFRTPLRTPSRPSEQPRVEPRVPEPRIDEPQWPPTAPPPDRAAEQRAVPPSRQGPLRAPSADDIDELPKRSRIGLLAALATVLI